MATADRLQAELRRLYLPEGGDGSVRALLLEAIQPAGWDELSQVWQGVQRDLELPAPAIAISGSEGYQLWFSLAQPVEPARATAFLQHLCRRYLPGVAPQRLRAQAVDDAAAALLPPRQLASERWSAFIAPDLTTLFAEERWLDHPPGQDAQADLLSRVASIPAQAFRRAEEQLAQASAAQHGASAAVAPTADGCPADPRAFLLSVLQDASVPLHLRIEAAKALLPGTGAERPR